MEKKKNRTRIMSNQSEMWPQHKVEHKLQGAPRGKSKSSPLAASSDWGVLQGSGFQPPLPVRIPTWSAKAVCCNAENAFVWWINDRREAIPEHHAGGLAADCMVWVISHSKTLLFFFLPSLALPFPHLPSDIYEAPRVLVTDIKKCNC